MAHKLFGRWIVSETRWKLCILGFILLYGLTINQFLHLRPDHMFLALVIFAFGFLGKERGKLFLIDWFPFILFWILYDMMRGVADSIKGGYVNVVEPYRLEALFFGWMTSHDIPAIWFAGWRVAHEGRWYKEILDLISANMYTFHFAAPLVLMWILWHTVDDLIIGTGYLAAAYLLTNRVLLPRIFDRFVDYQRGIRALSRELNKPVMVTNGAEREQGS